MASCLARPSAITPLVIISTPPASERRRLSFSARMRLTSTISCMGSPVLGATRTGLRPEADAAGRCRAVHCVLAAGYAKNYSEVREMPDNLIPEPCRLVTEHFGVLCDGSTRRLICAGSKRHPLTLGKERAVVLGTAFKGSSSRALVGLSQVVLYLERHVSRGMLRGRWRRVGPAPGWVSNRFYNSPSRAIFSAKPSTPPAPSSAAYVLGSHAEFYKGCQGSTGAAAG